MDLLHKMDAPKSDSSDTEDFFQELASLNDIGLLRATMESLECGRLTPLIKEELRCRIQSRRLSEGKEELLVEFPSPTPSQPRPDEVEKRDRRREQNRRAAQKFRKKKKERGEHLIEETQRLEYHNTSLRSEIKQLHEEREQLTRIIQNHASICPLTPRESPLTIGRDSPVPTGIRESPVTLAASSSSTIAGSPALGQRSAVTQSPVLLVPPTRESPVPLLMVNSGEEVSVLTSVIPSSPVPMSGRPRKSPVSLLRSPGSGDKSGTKSPTFGSPAKQTKHSVPPRLSLAGPKPMIPILPKPTSSAFPGSPSPRTPKTITSPLPIAPSPVSGSRAIHVSPVFFSEGGFTPTNHGQQANHSPLSASNSSSSSTPGRIAQQSPVFFGDRVPSTAHTNSHFLQPLSTSSVSSTSSLASLLRQESPLSVLSNSSGTSSASSVFISNNTNLNTCFSGITENPRLASNNDNSNIFNSVHSFQDEPQSVYSSSSQSSFPETADDNVLSLEEIEKSASGFETRDDLLEFMDIQALLELSADHNGNDAESNAVLSGNIIQCHTTNQNGNSIRHLEIEHSNDTAVSASDIGTTSDIRHNENVCGGNSVPPTSQHADPDLFSRLLPQDLHPITSVDTGHTCDVMVSADSSGQLGTSLAIDHNLYHVCDVLTERDCRHHAGCSTTECDCRYNAGCSNIEQDKSCRNSFVSSGQETLQRRSESAQGHATNLHQLHNLLRDIILAQTGHVDSVETTTIRNFLLNKVTRELDPDVTNNGNDLAQGSSSSNNHLHIQRGSNPSDCNMAASNQDLVNLHSTFPSDMLLTSRRVCDNRPDNVLSQKSYQST